MLCRAIAAALIALVLAATAGPAAAKTCGKDWRQGPAGVFFNDPAVFPLGVWLQAPKRAAAYRAAGINLYVGQWKGPTTGQLEALHAAGMPVIAEPTPAARDPAFADTVVGWLLPDEPDNAQRKASGKGIGPPMSTGEVMRRYCEAAAIEPARPVHLQLGMGVAWDAWKGRGVRTGHLEDYPPYVAASDIVSFDIYPVTSARPGLTGRIELIGQGVSRLAGWATHGQRVWAMIGVSRIANAAVQPSPEQIRSQIWMALVHGAQGLIYFVHQFKPTFQEDALLGAPEALAAVTAENARIQRLAPVLNAPSLPAAVAVVDRGKAVALAKDFGPDRYVFVVSLTPSPQTVGLRLQAASGKATVIDEDRALAIKGGRLSDTFAGYGVHLYRFRRGD